jgi:hypothetical protein
MSLMKTSWSATGRPRLLGLAAALLVLSAAACGGGGKATTSTAAAGVPTAQWANGVCSAFTTWKTSLQSIQGSVTSQPSTSALKQAGTQIESATETLAKSLKQLGKPDTAQGEAAKQNLDTLATTLEGGLNKIKTTLNTNSSGAAGALAQISTITTTLSAMANNLKIAGANMKNFAPSGELKQAFEQAKACQPYLH